MKDILIKIMLGIGINPPGRFQNKIVDLKTGKLILHPNNNESIDINTLSVVPYSIYHDIEQPFLYQITVLIEYIVRIVLNILKVLNIQKY